MKKVLFIVAVLAIMVPASFARTYNQGALGGTNDTQSGGTFSGTVPTIPLTAQGGGLPGTQGWVAWEKDNSNTNIERKAESWSWPAQYIAQNIMEIPVKMDVGFWIRVNGSSDLVMKLKQIEIHKYSGSLDVTVVTNYSMIMTVSMTITASLSSSVSSTCKINGADSLVISSGTTTFTITEVLTSVDISNLPGGNTCYQVGYITLKAVPNVTPYLVGGCGN